MQTHPREGFNRTWGEEPKVAKLIVTHHEFQGDRSYPRRTRREDPDQELLCERAIVALADVIDALSTERPYKKAWPEDRVREEVDAKFQPYLPSNLLNHAVILGKNYAGKTIAELSAAA